MDNIKNIPERVSVFATTNMPWELDIAALRRFERKILVPMPDKETREKVLRLHSGPHQTLSEEDMTYLAEHTEGYSGSDLSTLVNDALMRPIKQLQQATHFKKMDKREFIQEISEKSSDSDEEDLMGSIWLPVFSEEDKQNATEMDLAAISEKEVYVRKANLVITAFDFINVQGDFKKSIENCKPTVHLSFLDLYAKFLEKYGHSD